MHAASEDDIRKELVKACKVLFRTGIVDLAGHISYRLDANRILIKPRAVNWLTLGIRDLVVIDQNGKQEGAPAGANPPEIEWPIHVAVYEARQDVQCVLHAHPEDSTLAAGLNIDLEPLTRDLFFYSRSVPVYQSDENLRYENAQIKTIQRAQEVAHTLGKDPALVLLYHGTVIAAATIGGVVVASYLLERASASMLKAASIAPLPAIDERFHRALAIDDNASPVARPDLVEERWEMLQAYYLENTTMATTPSEPIVGSWYLTVITLGQPQTTFRLTTFTSDQVFITTGYILGGAPRTAHGTWTKIGDSEYSATWRGLRHDGTNFRGFVKSRATIQVYDPGDKLSLEYVTEGFDPDGNLVNTLRGTAEGVRIDVEPL